ncbi:hypothetical protein C8A00DRAFT_15554 [Chaetomidium leptoderma]|uniref:Uncharacterized protein n=1 Tax=Chaetomidium leptoderma TaxID=669021 RepID=A0AAN6VLY7_9PEZI|nr:hypothetical protein C8A00DRAFT_15554 [Chaetomidium leptoderma]
MVGCATQAPGLNTSNRIRPSGLKIMTTSHAIASIDWRKRAAALSSPGTGAKRRKQSYDESDDIRIQLDFERDDSFSGPQYRYPREKKAPWETVLSAPAWQIPSSSTSISGEGSREVTKIQLQRVNPIITSVNGEDITLPNRFSFDVAVVDPHNASPGLPLGELKCLNGQAPFRRLSSEDSNDLLVELQQIVGCNRETLSSATSASSEYYGYLIEKRPQRKQDGSDSAISGFSVVDAGSDNARMAAPSEEETRFQRMLNRLQNEKQPPPPTHRATDDVAMPSRRIVDPAIMAIKVKDKVQVPERGSHSGPDKDAANTYFAQQLSHMRDAGHQNSTDSGYATNDREHNSSDRSCVGHAEVRTDLRHTRKESSLDDGHIKTLNPAAAKFKSTVLNDGMAWLAPKKLSRPPLTNIFPDAMPNHPPPPHTIAPERTLPQQPQQTRIPAIAEQPLENRVIDTDVLAKASAPTSQSVLPRPGFAGSMNGIPPNGFPAPNTLPHQIMSPMGLAATMSAATLADSSLLSILGGLPSPAPLHSPLGVPTINLPAINGFNTFPPAAGGPMSIFGQTSTPGLGNPCLPITAPFITVPPPQQPSLGPDDKQLNRPYFPVTTKPRDHDPVKQQMYEAYLEWRKVNEPGYHMKCKMRQANRVMRQCQVQQDKEMSSDPTTWKTIAEKAKAAVGAAAAAVEAEKRRHQEQVREELRVKVRELSQGSQKTVC